MSAVEDWPEDLLRPRHGHSTIAEVVPALAARLTGSTPVDPWPLPAARRYVVLLVDGMGADLLATHHDLAPHLSDMTSIPGLTCAVPSTTATSLSCLGTGRSPGRHGIVGYTFRSPDGGVMNALSWSGGDEPEAMQPHATAFEELAGRQVAVTSVCPARFERSGLTRATLRGPRFVGVRDEDDVEARAELAAEAARRAPVSLTYVYERSLDHVGHGQGVASQQWQERLAWVDGLVAAIASRLPRDTVLVVTADHGMVDVTARSRLVAEDLPGGLDGVDVIAGEPRLRQLYTEDPSAVARRWRALMGERALVVEGREALAEGLFGPVDPRMARRVGDVLVLARQDWAVMTTRMPQEFSLVGMHGSLTGAEMRVPLLVETAGSR